MTADVEVIGHPEARGPAGVTAEEEEEARGPQVHKASDPVEIGRAETGEAAAVREKDIQTVVAKRGQARSRRAFRTRLQPR
jgi:hypothetical protein